MSLPSTWAIPHTSTALRRRFLKSVLSIPRWLYAARTVTVRFRPSTSRVVSTPSGETDAQATEKDDTPTINLVGDQIRFKDKLVTLEVLNERLAAMDLKEKEGEKRVILLEASHDTPYEVFFQALAAISSNGGIVAMMEEDE